MANKFEQFGYNDKPKDKTEAAPRKPNQFEQFAQPGQPSGERHFDNPVADYVYQFMQNMNDAMTFGLFSKGLEATGVNPNAEEDLAVAKANPWASIPGELAGYGATGAGLSTAAARIPGLAVNSIPAIFAREGLAAGTQQTADDAIREGKVDPLHTILATGAGGVLGAAVGGGSRLFPGGRVRAAGRDLSEDELLNAELFGQQAATKGVDLTIPEILEASGANNKGAARVRAALDNAAKAPEGSIRINAFNKDRTPGIKQAGLNIVDELRGGGAPVTAEQTAQAARDIMGDVSSGFTTTARPYYDAAMTRPNGNLRQMPPSWISKDGATSLGAKEVRTDPVRQKGMRNEAGLPKGQIVPENSILFLDAVQKAMKGMKNQSGDPVYRGYIQDEVDSLLSSMDKVAPEYPVARSISEQGREARAALEEGPIGQLSNQRSTESQAGTIFNANDEPTMQGAMDATAMLGPDLPIGILANRIEQAVSKDPLRFGKKALPTPQSKQIADTILDRGGKQSVRPTLEAVSAVDNHPVHPFANDHSSPLGALWQTLTDVGKGRQADMLLNRSNIRKLGKAGPGQKVATRLTEALLQDYLERQDERRGKKKQVLDLGTIFGGNNSTPAMP